MQRNECADYNPVKNINEKFEALTSLLNHHCPTESIDLKQSIIENARREKLMTELKHQTLSTFIQRSLQLYQKSNLSWLKSKISSELEQTLNNSNIDLDTKLEAITEYTSSQSNIGRNLYKSIRQAEAEVLDTFSVNAEKLPNLLPQPQY